MKHRMLLSQTPNPHISAGSRDATTLLPFRGLYQYEKLISHWFQIAHFKLQNETRDPWQNYTVALGIAAVRASRTLGVLAATDATEGMQCVARHIVELVTRFVHAVDYQGAAYRYESECDARQRGKITSAATASRRRWLTTLPPGGPLPSGTGSEPYPEAGSNIGLTAEYKWLCLSTHNHVTALKRKYPGHWEHTVAPVEYCSGHELRGPLLDPFDSEPPSDIERYLHIAVDAMAAAEVKLWNTPGLTLDSDEQRRHSLNALDALLVAFRKACPER